MRATTQSNRRVQRGHNQATLSLLDHKQDDANGSLTMDDADDEPPTGARPRRSYDHPNARHPRVSPRTTVRADRAACAGTGGAGRRGDRAEYDGDGAAMAAIRRAVVGAAAAIDVVCHAKRAHQPGGIGGGPAVARVDGDRLEYYRAGGTSRPGAAHHR